MIVTCGYCNDADSDEYHRYQWMFQHWTTLLVNVTCEYRIDGAADDDNSDDDYHRYP